MRTCRETIPRATFERAARFMNPILAVSSTSPSAPRSASSAADISSLTVGGVWHTASAYSITRRSSGVNTVDSRHRGTSRAFSTARPRL